MQPEKQVVFNYVHGKLSDATTPQLSHINHQP